MFFYEECHTSICVVTIDLKNKLLLVGQSGKKSAEKMFAGKKSAGKKSAGKKSNLSHLGFLGLPFFRHRWCLILTKDICITDLYVYEEIYNNYLSLSLSDSLH